MELQSARDLKAEILETLVHPFVKASLELEPHEAANKMLSTFGMLVKPLSLAASAHLPGFHRSIALGVAPAEHGFKLAIRLQRQGLANSPLIEQIVRRAKGEVDMRLIGRVEKRQAPKKAKPMAAPPWFQGDSRPLTIGSSIAHANVTAGTLGAFVTKHGVPYVLSNNHVLANENAATVGDVVLQRSRADGGVVGQQDAAVLSQWIPLNTAGPTPCDAAIAEVKTSAFDQGLLRGIRNGVDARLAGLGLAKHVATSVCKIGRTTGITFGKITALDMDNIVVSYAPGNVQFNDSIEIESITAEPFCDGGDSGSLILNEQMEAIGLLYAGTEMGGSNGLGLTYAHHLKPVLESFGVKLMT